MTDKIITELYFDGKSPQKAIRYLTDLVNRQKEADKRFLVIEEYYENYSNPFEQNPTRCLKLVVRRPKS